MRVDSDAVDPKELLQGFVKIEEKEGEKIGQPMVEPTIKKIK